MADPEFVEMMVSAERELSYVDGARMAQIAATATNMSPEVKAIMVAAVQGEI